MKTITATTYDVLIYIAGDLAKAASFLSREFYPPNKGGCATITPTTYVYTGGVEAGMVIGFINYPRFIQQPQEIFERAKDIAERLMVELCQLSCTVEASDKTVWLTHRKEDNQEPATTAK